MIKIKNFLKYGNAILFCCTLAAFGVVLDSTTAQAVDYTSSNIVNVNINMFSKSQNQVSDNYEEYFETVDLTQCDFSIGSQFEEIVAEPKPIVLDKFAVPDGEGVCNSLNKTYMDYTAVTNHQSAQYALLNSDLAYTDTTTGLRMVDGRICIAVGTFYASTIGTKINLVMATGEIVECVLGDVKSDLHTDPTHRYQAVDGSVVEMIVDETYFSSTSQYPDSLNGRVVRIEIVE